MKKDTQLPLKTGLNIFVVFFGAGFLIFPLYLGIKSGNGYPFAMMDDMISGVLMTLLSIWGFTNNQYNLQRKKNL